MKYKLLAIVLILLSLNSSAQNILRVANINPNGSSFVSDLTVFNDKIYFAASDSDSRSQLWVTDGTEQGTTLVKSFCSGYNCFSPIILANLNNRLLFAAPYNNACALWSTDGTPSGTQMIKEVEVAICCTAYKRVVVNNKLYFTGNDGTSGYELWCTDGTTAGTYMVADIRPGFNGSDPRELCAFNNKVCFAASDSMNNTEPWISDGTDTGTHMLIDVSPTGSSDPEDFFSYNNTLFFCARDNNNNAPYNMWLSDGTYSGTHKLDTIDCYNFGLHFEYNSQLYISLDSIYTTDGTDTGTHPFANLHMGFPLIYHNKLYFDGSKGNYNDELWVSDGTYTGTQLLKEIDPSLSGSSVAKLTVFHNKLIFSASDGTNGREMWVSDGTATGTYKLLFPNATHSDPLSSYDFSPFIEYHGELYFGAEYDNSGLELWKFNDSPTSINETVPNTGALRLEPNPAKDFVTVYTTESSQIIITDLIGHVISTNEISGTATINVSSYSPGIYFIADKKGHSTRLIKE